ncbi:MAG: phosphohydrolase, partial [bacterium]|nr:phosphohydrolase [bacterium]
QPDKKLSSVDVNSVMKKFPNKNFAAGAKRDQIATCEEALGIDLEDFVKLSLEAMQGVSSDLGL